MRPLLISCLLLAGCHGDPVVPTPTIPVAGLWVGVIGTDPVALTLSEADGVITGSGTLASTAVTVTGQYSTPPAVTLTITPTGVTVLAVVSESVIGGVAVGSGYPLGTPVALSRQGP
jgi:hypothetical protein